MRSANELGFLSVALVPISFALMENMKYIDNSQKQEGMTTTQIVEENINDNKEGVVKETVASLIGNLAYLAMPYFADLYQVVNNFYSSIEEMLQSILSKVVKSNMISNIVGFMFSSDDSDGNSAIGKIMAYFTTIYLYNLFIEMLPLALITVVVTITIIYYIARIMIVYLLAPFFVIYALSTGQESKIVHFFKNLIMLAFKPIFLVMFCALTIMCTEILSNISASITDENMEFMKTVSGYSSGVTSFFTNIPLTITQTFIKMGSHIAIIIFSIWLILKGQTIVGNFFGVREDTNLQNDIGHLLEDKATKGMKEA